MRIKRSIAAKKKRRKALSLTKGFRWGRKSKYRLAKDALRHAWTYAYRDRKAKKRVNRGLWQIRIGAACQELGMSYSKFIGNLKKANISLDRKVLSELAKDQPTVFSKIVERVK